jgi:hypothetical protein
MLNEHPGSLKFPRPSALREVTGDRDDVVVSLGDERFDCLVLLRHRGMTEVQVGAVEQRRR